MTTETHIEGPANNTKEPTPPSRRGRWAFPCSLRMLGPARRWAVNATGQRTALWRCDLGAELPLVAVLRPSLSDPNRSITELKSGHLHHCQ